MCDGGSRSCPHKVDKGFCSNTGCGGGQRLCKHLRDKRYCHSCGGKNICIKCKINGVRKIGMDCKTCTPSTNNRGRYKEARLCVKLELWAAEGHIPKYTTWGKLIPHTQKVLCGRVFPDFSYEFHNFVLILEVDEFQHKNSGYSKRCELVRMQDIVNSYGNMPLCFVRYNPDRCKIAGKSVYPTAEEKHKILLNFMKDAMSRKIWSNHITLNYICYDCSECASIDSCPLIHTKTFATMLDFAQYIEKTSPLVQITPK